MNITFLCMNEKDLNIFHSRAFVISFKKLKNNSFLRGKEDNDNKHHVSFEDVSDCFPRIKITRALEIVLYLAFNAIKDGKKTIILAYDEDEKDDAEDFLNGWLYLWEEKPLEKMGKWSEVFVQSKETLIRSSQGLITKK